MIDGKVTTFISSKNYGFVKGDDGEDYFLHGSALLEPHKRSELKKGSLVTFDPTPTKKGLAAQKVSLYETFFREIPVDFFMTKSDKPKYGKIHIVKHGFATRYFKDLDDAKDHLSNTAKKVNANAILNLDHETEKRKDGNYIYTVHAFHGDFALVVSKPLPCGSSDEVITAQKIIENKENTLKNNFDKVKADEDRIRNYKSPLAKIIFFGIVVITGIIIYSNLTSNSY